MKDPTPGEKSTKWITAIPVIGALSLLLAMVGLFGGLFVWAHWPLDWPSDNSATKLFEEHRSSFQRLVEMVREDRLTGAIPQHSVRIDPSWGDPDGANSQTKGLSKQRFAEYVVLFKRLRLRYGLTVGEKEEVQFNLACIGTLTIGPCSYKGLVYKPDRQYWVTVDSLEDKSLPGTGGIVAPGFYLKVLSPNWFIYRQEFD
jgi:hypothetical protein